MLYFFPLFLSPASTPQMNFVNPAWLDSFFFQKGPGKFSPCSTKYDHLQKCDKLAAHCIHNAYMNVAKVSDCKYCYCSFGCNFSLYERIEAKTFVILNILKISYFSCLKVWIFCSVFHLKKNVKYFGQSREKFADPLLYTTLLCRYT